MKRGITAFYNFIRSNLLTLFGGLLATLFGPLLILGILADIFYPHLNPYIGFIIYLVLPVFFVTGLVFVAIGAYLRLRRTGESLSLTNRIQQIAQDPENVRTTLNVTLVIGALTFVNIAIISLIGYNSYHYMDSVSFCGTVCHTVMEPEYSAYKRSQHSRVECVTCHIGSGADWFVKSKLSGLRQVVAVTFDSFHRPIETPLENLRPARDTCEECHRPELFHGDKLSIRHHFQEDEKNTRVTNAILLKIGSGGLKADKPHGIHWHVAKENEIVYYYEDEDRMKIPVVEVRAADGEPVVYQTSEWKDKDYKQLDSRTLDCIDCHNRPTHIYLPANIALDNKFLSGELTPGIPFIKKQAMDAIQKDYNSQEQARKSIGDALMTYYQKNQAEWLAKEGSRKLLEGAVSAVQDAYCENVFPAMKVGWGTYTSHLGHERDKGCFRCHDEEHETSDGAYISQDCSTCHAVLAYEEEEPEILETLKGEF